jgi:hypothetical protein
MSDLLVESLDLTASCRTLTRFAFDGVGAAIRIRLLHFILYNSPFRERTHFRTISNVKLVHAQK